MKLVSMTGTAVRPDIRDVDIQYAWRSRSTADRSCVAIQVVETIWARTAASGSHHSTRVSRPRRHSRVTRSQPPHT
jgi:hypothetical protein